MFFYNSQLFSLLTSISFSLYFLYSSFACCCFPALCLFNALQRTRNKAHKRTRETSKFYETCPPARHAQLFLYKSEYSFPTSHTPFLCSSQILYIYIFLLLVAMVRGKTNFLSAALTAFFGNMTILWHTHVCYICMCISVYVCVQVLKLNTY